MNLIAQGHPERTAVFDERTGERTGYGELGRAIDVVREAVRHNGLQAGDRVAVSLTNSVPFIAVFHGLYTAGCTILPLDPLAPEDRRVGTMSDARCAWLFDEDDAGTARFGRADGDRGRIDWSADPPRPLPEPPSAGDDAIAVLASTSGTSGAPKLAVLTRGNLAANLAQIHQRHALTARDVVLAGTPLRHIYGMQMAMNHTLASGATLVLPAPPFDAQRMLDLMRQTGVTVAYVVPSVVAALAAFAEPTAAPGRISSLRAVVSGGAPLGHEVAERCASALGTRVIQGFGMTEAGCTHLQFFDPGARPPASGSVGPPLPDTEVRLVDPATGETVPDGHEGELWVRGPQIGPGYLGAPEASGALRTEDGWLRTGDLARAGADGSHTITGRIKSLIKYKGYQVSPVELEQVLLTHPAIADAAVIGVPDAMCGQLPKAFVVLREAVDLADLTAHVAERVAPQCKVRQIAQVARIPRNANGKVDGSRLGRSLEGSTVLITGAGGGLGGGFARALAGAGATLILTGRSLEPLERAAADLAAHGAEVRAIPTDVTDPFAVRAAVELAEKEFGAIDVLVNNAAIGGPLGPTWTTDPERWQQTLDINLHGAVTTCRAVLPGMTARRHGRIINITSAAGRHRWPHASAYSVSKAALDKLTENLACELREHGVHVFGFDPGLLDIGLTRRHDTRGPEDEPWAARIAQWFQEQRDAGRLTEPEKAAESLVLLADGTADVLSGRCLTSRTDIFDLARHHRSAS